MSTRSTASVRSPDRLPNQAGYGVRGSLAIRHRMVPESCLLAGPRQLRSPGVPRARVPDPAKPGGPRSPGSGGTTPPEPEAGLRQAGANNVVMGEVRLTSHAACLAKCCAGRSRTPDIPRMIRAGRARTDGVPQGRGLDSTIGGNAWSCDCCTAIRRGDLGKGASGVTRGRRPRSCQPRCPGRPQLISRDWSCHANGCCGFRKAAPSVMCQVNYM
jgi:hypothetical protein